MTQKIQTALTQALAGDAFDHTDPAVTALLEEMRCTTRNPQALKELGMATLKILNAHLRSVVAAEKAVQCAKGGCHE